MNSPVFCTKKLDKMDLSPLFSVLDSLKSIKSNALRERNPSEPRLGYHSAEPRQGCRSDEAAQCCHCSRPFRRSELQFDCTGGVKTRDLICESCWNDYSALYERRNGQERRAQDMVLEN